MGSVADKEHCMWYGQYVLIPQIKQMPYEFKKYVWKELFSEIMFEDAFYDIINYNFAHQDDIIKLRENEKLKNLTKYMDREVHLTPEETNK